MNNMNDIEISDLANDIVVHMKHRIDFMAIEMNDDRNDGWVKEHYRNSLREIRDYINKALEK
jgi:hypothetical protein